MADKFSQLCKNGHFNETEVEKSDMMTDTYIKIEKLTQQSMNMNWEHGKAIRQGKTAGQKHLRSQQTNS